MLHTGVSISCAADAETMQFTLTQAIISLIPPTLTILQIRNTSSYRYKPRQGGGGERVSAAGGGGA